MRSAGLEIRGHLGWEGACETAKGERAVVSKWVLQLVMNMVEQDWDGCARGQRAEMWKHRKDLTQYSALCKHSINISYLLCKMMGVRCLRYL